VTGASGEEVRKTIQLATLEPATLTVAALDPAILLSVRLPHGEEMTVLANQDMKTGAGTAKLTGHIKGGDDQLTHEFEVPPGESALPLPGGVTLTVGGEVRHRQLLLPGSGSSGTQELAVPKSGDRETFAVALKPGTPGQFQVVEMDFGAVPAVKAYSTWRSLKTQKNIYGVSTVLSGVGAVVGFSMSRKYNDAAAGQVERAGSLSGAGSQGRHDTLLENAEVNVQYSNLAMIGSIGGATVSAVSAVFFYLKGSKTSKARKAFDTAKVEPYQP